MARDGIDGRAEVQPRYALSLRLLHWLLAILIVVQVGLAWSVPEGPNSFNDPRWPIHAGIGPIILVLALVRFAVRQMTHVPALPAELPGWQKFVARANQGFMYLLMVLQPLTGWAIWSVYGSGPKVLGVIQLPPLITPAAEGVDKAAFAAPYVTGHALLATLLVLSVAAHVAGALYHGLVRKDGVLPSMASLKA